jgi:pSer/pThr/pTyr-binding forkhead associated (FHA) protein
MLQEFDLPNGSTIIGRSLDCHVTLEDPLVSRRHARIVVDQAGARIEDMGSRNGVRVNGGVISDPVQLQNSDRIRIGTQDFVFCAVDASGRSHSRTTGQLRICVNCHQPYPREMLACPNCEATEQTDEDTLTGAGRAAPNAWTLQLMTDSLERALKMGRTVDAERIVRRATHEVEEQLATGGALDNVAVSALSVQAVEMTLASDDPSWAVWAIDVHGRTQTMPPSAVIDRLSDVPPRMRPALRGALDDFMARRETPAETSAPAESIPPDGSGEEAPHEDGGSDDVALSRLRDLRREFGDSR